MPSIWRALVLSYAAVPLKSAFSVTSRPGQFEMADPWAAEAATMLLLLRHGFSRTPSKQIQIDPLPKTGSPAGCQNDGSPYLKRDLRFTIFDRIADRDPDIQQPQPGDDAAHYTTRGKPRDL